MTRWLSRWPVWIALALLVGCGDAPTPTGEMVDPRDAAAQTLPAEELSQAELAPVSAASLEAAVAADDEEAGESLLPELDSLEALEAQMEELLAAGSRVKLRQALRRLLQLRESSQGNIEFDAEIEEWARRAAYGLVDWDMLALEHQEPELAERDLSLLRRWNAEDQRVTALAARLERVQEILTRLERIDKLMAGGRLPGPESHQAVAQLYDVLRLEPGHAGALRRLVQIEVGFLEEALAAAHGGKFEQANTLLAEAGKVRSGSARVQDTATRVMEIREHHIEQWKARIFSALAVGDVAGAEALLPDLDSIALDERDGVAARAEIERVRLYGAYDVGALLADPLVDGGFGPGMIVIPAGRFSMGSLRSEKGHQPSEGRRHAVRFARGFALARTETTVAQFRAFVEASGYRSTAQKKRKSMVYDERSGALVERRRVTWSDDYTGQPATDDEPVMHVSFKDAQAYVAWLTEQAGVRYRLPSEAEFEYALRAGSTTVYPWGDSGPPPGTENLTGALDESPTKRQWSNAFPGYGDGYWGPAPVGRFASNGFGLNDINGNVSEWVEDCWHDSYSRAPQDGSAWVNPGCPRRVVRGASWASSPDQARSAFRTSAPEDTVSARVGFRVARDL